MWTHLALALCALSGTALAQTVYPTGTTIWEAGTNDGYTLFIPPSGQLLLMDMSGNEVRTWESPITGHVLSILEPLKNGHFLAFSSLPNAFPRVVHDVFEFDADGELAWSFTLRGVPNTTLLHHDMERLPNGNTLLLGRQRLTNLAISPDPIDDDFLMEVSQDGSLLWFWELNQHFDEFGFDDEALALISDHAGDWAHANGISVIPPNDHTDPAFAEGNVIVSLRSTNTIFIIDRATDKIVWRVGPEPHLTFGQHNPSMIEQGLEGAGNILVFDNGSGIGYPLRRHAPGASRVIEIDPVTQRVVWSYGNWKYFHSDIVSGAQRLENGNTLICSGVKGRLFEVTRDGDIVWEYLSPYSVQTPTGPRVLVYRAYRLPYEWLPREHRRLAPDVLGSTSRNL
jgi:outer membrane protein assembly factor BamB